MADYKTYYGWYDPALKTPMILKAKRAIVQFTAKYGYEPAEMLVDEASAKELTALTGIELITYSGVPRNTFYIGPFVKEKGSVHVL
jgi:hypothetical protein